MSLIQNRRLGFLGGAQNVWGSDTIEASAWFDGAADYLADTWPATQNRTAWTLSFWIQRLEFGGSLATQVFSSGNAPQPRIIAGFLNDEVWFQQAVVGDYLFTALARDPGWYHLIFVWDTDNATSSDRIRAYMNGQRLPLRSGSMPSSGTVSEVNTSGSIVEWGRAATSFFGKFALAQAAFLSGEANPTISDFGEEYTVGNNGSIWVPKPDADIVALVNAAGSNSFCLTSAIGDGTDASTNSNNFTPNSMSHSANGQTNTPSNPLPVFAPQTATDSADMTITEGGTKLETTVNQRTLFAVPSIPSSGLWYFEVEATNYVSGGGSFIGISAGGFADDISRSDAAFPDNVAFATYDGDYYSDGGGNDATGLSGVNIVSDGDILQFAIDVDNGLFWAGLNNTWADGVTPSEGGSGATTLGFPEGILSVYLSRGGSYNETYKFLFDEADWTYSAPTGFKSFAAANRPDPETQGADVFQAVPYEGNGSTQSITGVGFTPDLNWIKNRDATDDHVMTSVVRGVGNILIPNASTAEAADADTVTSFDSDGFSLGADVKVNTNNESYIAFNWLGGGTGVSNTDGDITSTVSVASQGHFSVGTYAKTASGNQSVGHGLPGTPDAVFIKDAIDVNIDWYLQHVFNGSAFRILLNSSAARVTDTSNNVWGGVDANATTFTVEDQFVIGDDQFFFALRSVPGICLVDSYEGNGANDGPYVACGFRPRWVMIKRNDSTGSWLIYDTARSSLNEVDDQLVADANTAETTGSEEIDILSDGFKVRTSDAYINASGGRYLFFVMADVVGGGTLPPVPAR